MNFDTLKPELEQLERRMEELANQHLGRSFCPMAMVIVTTKGVKIDVSVNAYHRATDFNDTFSASIQQAHRLIDRMAADMNPDILAMTLGIKEAAE